MSINKSLAWDTNDLRKSDQPNIASLSSAKLRGLNSIKFSQPMSDEIIKQFNDYGDEEPFAIYWSEYATSNFSTTYFSIMERVLNKFDSDKK
ncbi:MAG: hypothetical protein IIB45_08070, partial [Candidatus Marinimicrobia bacterium]|nr:hypothetical protein [Candidatus Neomarinimicrobiota bacterium]